MLGTAGTVAKINKTLAFLNLACSRGERPPSGDPRPNVRLQL